MEALTHVKALNKAKHIHILRFITIILVSDAILLDIRNHGKAC